MQSVRKYGVFVLGLILSLSACHKKQEAIVISGTISDHQQGILIEGAEVELYTRRIESGIYSANYDLFDLQLSDEQGNFKFDLPNKTYALVKLVFYKQNYYTWEYQIEGDVLKEPTGFYATFDLKPKAWVQFEIKNEKPEGNGDYFEFRLLNGYTHCEDCCGGEKYAYSGQSVDAGFLCQVIGHQDILIQWFARKGGKQSGTTDSFFVPAFDTTHIDLFY